MATALEMYFMASGIFGTNGRPPMRIIHCFPNLIHVFAYAKIKLNNAIVASLLVDDPVRPGGRKRPYISLKIDSSSPSNDSLQFKQFVGGNFLRVESTGLEADRLRGGTVDALFYDECFPYDQNIETNDGKYKIGQLYNMFMNNEKLPLVKTYNETTEEFEYKRILNAWNRGEKPLIKLTCGNREIKCTANHRFLTTNGWKEAGELKNGNLIKTTPDFNSYGLISVNDVQPVLNSENVYDIEVEDNHNFIVTSVHGSKNLGGLIAHNCQDIPIAAISNANKLLSQARYGTETEGVQVYFGTPKQRGTDYWKMWNDSSQQYFQLGCEKCGKHFPLYTPSSNDWEKVWLYGFIVKCVHCNHEQDKRPAADRGKWVAINNNENCKFVGYHINQLYMPNFTKEKILSNKPENSPIATERSYQNEVLGEFYTGDAAPITPEELHEKCADAGRKMRASISVSDKKKVYAGFDWGKKQDVDGQEKIGQSYSSAVVITADGPHLLSIQFATLLRRNDFEYKKQLVEQMFRQYSVGLAVGDIGYANDLTEVLQREYGNRFLASEAKGNIKNHIKFVTDEFPNTIRFDRDYYIADLFDMLKKGNIRFPYGDYEKISWLITHCCSMDIKTTSDRFGEPISHYIKGATPNDGFMALLNAYLAYKFDITNGFSESTLINPNNIQDDLNVRRAIPAVTGYIPRM